MFGVSSIFLPKTYKAMFLDSGASDTELLLNYYGDPTLYPMIRYWTNGTLTTLPTYPSPISLSTIFQKISGTQLQVGGAISIQFPNYGTDNNVALIGMAKGGSGSDMFRIFEMQNAANEFVAMTFCDAVGICQIGIVTFEEADENSPIEITLPKRRNFSNPSCSVTFNGEVYKNNDVITVTMSPEDAFQLQAECDLTGTLIKSEKPIAVFSGSHDIVVGWGNSKDFMMEQLIPTAYWGNEYIIYPYPESLNGDIVSILAHKADTEVRIVGYGNYLIKEARQFIRRRIENDRAVRIWASKKISVVQYILDYTNEASAMVVVQPIANYVDKILTHTDFETYLIAKTNQTILQDDIIPGSSISTTVLDGAKRVNKSEYLSGKVDEQGVTTDFLVQYGTDDRVGGYVVSKESGNMLMATSCGFKFELPVSIEKSVGITYFHTLSQSFKYKEDGQIEKRWLWIFCYKFPLVKCYKMLLDFLSL